MAQISAAFGIPLGTVEHRSAAEGWGAQRDEARKEVQRLLSAMADSDTALALVTHRRGASRLVTPYITEAAKLLTAGTALDPQGLRALVAATRDSLRLSHEAAGIPLVPTGDALDVVGGGRWLLLREALPVGASSPVIDVIPEEDGNG